MLYCLIFDALVGMLYRLIFDERGVSCIQTCAVLQVITSHMLIEPHSFVLFHMFMELPGATRSVF